MVLLFFVENKESLLLGSHRNIGSAKPDTTLRVYFRGLSLYADLDASPRNGKYVCRAGRFNGPQEHTANPETEEVDIAAGSPNPI